MTSGEKLKKTLGLDSFYEVWITRTLVQSTKPIYFVVVDSKRKSMPLPKNRLKISPYVSMIYNGSDLQDDKFKTPTMTPLLNINRWNGKIQTGLFIVVDVAYNKLLRARNYDKLPENVEDKYLGIRYYSFDKNKIKEFVTLKDLLDKDVVDPHVDEFAKERQSIMGGENKNAKLLECNLDIANDWVTFIWLTEATPKYSDDHVYKELPDKKNYNTKSKKSILKVNKSKTYELHLRLLDIQKNIKELDIENEITKANMKTLIELSNVQIFSNSPAFQYTGVNYVASTLDASIKPTNIPPQKPTYDSDGRVLRWGWEDLRGNSVLDKHLRNLFKKGSIDLFLNQMASMLTSKLKKRDIL